MALGREMDRKVGVKQAGPYLLIREGKQVMKCAPEAHIHVTLICPLFRPDITVSSFGIFTKCTYDFKLFCGWTAWQPYLSLPIFTKTAGLSICNDTYPRPQVPLL